MGKTKIEWTEYRVKGKSWKPSHGPGSVFKGMRRLSHIKEGCEMIGGMTVAEMIGIGQEALKKYDGYEYIGIRVQDLLEIVGTEMEHRSRVWEDGLYTCEELNGVCAVNARADYAKNNSTGYFGEYMIVLGSFHASWGEDVGEIIMEDPEVLECIKRE